MSLTPGARLGPYEIISAIGAGGMGEVYRARDTKLHRDVAIKVLPDLFASDSERLARFEREARLLAALNHSNIAHVYGVEGAALIMEFVDGEDLAQRLSRGPIPLDEAIPVAAQIVEALEAAHEQGIVHRDLKPANIKVRPDGAVKVLDFGLAKALDPVAAAAAADPSNSPTLTARATQAGVILGTAAYMAPEQARGKPVDKRADIWAFGCVLYEMLTGTRAFAGEDATDTMAAVVRADPDWAALPAETPPVIRTLLRRCLEKDRRERLPDIGAARLDLKDAATRPAEPPPRPVASRRGALAAWVGAAALAAAALAGFAVWGLVGAPVKSPGSEFVVLPPEPGVRLGWIAVSPDGRALAFISDSQGVNTLWIRTIDALAARPVAGSEGANFPFWSPDGEWLAFFSHGKLNKVAAAGGPIQALCEAPAGRGGTWGPGDVILFTPTAASPLHRVSASGGVSTPLTTFDKAAGESTHRFPVFLPGGRHFLYNTGVAIGQPLQLAVGSLDGGAPVRLFEGSNAAFADGHLIYVRQRTLMAQPFDPAARRVTGDARPLARGLRVEATGGSFLSAGPGTLAYRAPDAKSTLTWFNRQGTRIGAVSASFDPVSANLSPDDQRLIVSTRRDDGLDAELWIVDVSRSASSPFLADGAGYGYAGWSPDGADIVYAARPDGGRGPLGFFVKAAGGAGAPRALVTVVPPRALPLDVQLTPDRRFVLSVVPDQRGQTDIWALPAGSGGEPTLVATRAFQPQLSADGRWLGYTSTTGRAEIVLQEFPDATRRIQISTAGGSNMRWRADMRELFYAALDGTLMAVSLVPADGAFKPGVPVPLFSPIVSGVRLSATQPAAFAVTRDGQKFLVLTPGTPVPESYVVTLNWRARIGAP